MMTHFQPHESAHSPLAEPDHAREVLPTPEKPVPLTPPSSAPAERQSRKESAVVRHGVAHRLREEMPVDLVQEGANMLELQTRQSRCVTLLSISSKATRALLRQF